MTTKLPLQACLGCGHKMNLHSKLAAPPELPNRITCPVCGRTSFHPRDVAEGYCAACHDWTSSPADEAEHDKPQADRLDEKPAPGDVTLCIRCGCAMIYDDDLRFRMPTVAELHELEQDRRVQHGIKAIARLDRPRRQ